MATLQNILKPFLQANFYNDTWVQRWCTATSSLSVKFNLQEVQLQNDHNKWAADETGITHGGCNTLSWWLPPRSWPVLLRLGPNMVLWWISQCTWVKWGCPWYCVTHARFRSLAVHQSEWNTSIFRDRLTSWGKKWKNGGGQTCLQLSVRDERPFGRPLGEGGLCPVVLSSPLHLSWVCQLCAAAALPCNNLFGAPPPSGSWDARGWRCTSTSSELLWPWTVGGKEPKFLSGRKSKCLKIKIHLQLKWKIKISASCVKQIQGNVDYFPRNCSITFNVKCNSHIKYWVHGYKGSM